MKSGSTFASSSEAAGGPSATWEPLAKALWDAITHDVTAEVLLLTPQGRVVFANRHAELFAGADAGALNGGSIRDLYVDTVATERLAHVGDVARTGTPMLLEGIVRGAWRVTSLRLLPMQEPLILQIDTSAPPPNAGPRTRLRSDDLGSLGALTTREREILALIGRGLSTVEIAEHLGRSVKTIEWHRVSLGTKLGVSNRVELAHIALRAGLAQIEIPANGRADQPKRRDGRRKVGNTDGE